MEAYTRQRTARHLASGNKQPLDQTELLLQFKDWIEGMTPEAAFALLRRWETVGGSPDDEHARINDAAFNDPALGADLALLESRITTAVRDFLSRHPGARPHIVIRHSPGAMHTAQDDVMPVIEIRLG